MKSDDMDVLVSKRSLVNEADIAEIDFEYEQNHVAANEAEVVQVVKIVEIKDGQMISVAGLLTVSLEEVNSRVINGQKKRLNENVVLSDDTGSIVVTLWEDSNDLLRNGVAWKLSNVRVKKFDGVRITTTPSTMHEEIDSADFPVPQPEVVSTLLDV